MIEPNDPDVIAIAGKLGVGEKLVALIINEYEGNVEEEGEEE